MQNKKLHPIMLVGTGSDVGKSVLSTALGRIFLQDGFCPAPFKAQNMALNSYVTKDGLEIGRAQAVQAEACRLEPDVNMNPVLLKPNSSFSSQVILNGRISQTRDAYSYYKKGSNDKLKKEAFKAFDSLQEKGYNPIVIEGAGSVAELNLRETDFVNMAMARYANADVILVADIERGGVFASCYGSIMLQKEEDRKRFKGIIINKFQGDIRLFEKGRKIIEDICSIKVLGVVPKFEGIFLDEEDSMQLKKKSSQPKEDKINIAVVLLKHISNFTDFNYIEIDKRVNLFYTTDVDDIENADIVILPGSKSTIDDLLFLRKTGIAKAIINAYKKGKKIIGICAGFQMLGLTISDEKGIESNISKIPGLGLLPINTIMQRKKTLKQVEFYFQKEKCYGYEIHQGNSSIDEPIIEKENIFGTYIHGILDNKVIIDYLLEGIKSNNEKNNLSYQEFRQTQYDLLASHVRKYVDIDKLYEILSL